MQARGDNKISTWNGMPRKESLLYPIAPNPLLSHPLSIIPQSDPSMPPLLSFTAWLGEC